MCAWSPLCRDGIAVIKFTKSRKMPRHCLMFDGFRPNEYRSGTCAGADDGYKCNAQPTCVLYPFAPPFCATGKKSALRA